MKLTEAFRYFGATLSNPRNQSMAFAPDGRFVISLWSSLFDVKNQTVTDSALDHVNSAWAYSMVEKAFNLKSTVNIIVPDYVSPVYSRSLSGYAKDFDPKPWVGKIVSFDKETGVFTIKYEKALTDPMK